MDDIKLLIENKCKLYLLILHPADNADDLDTFHWNWIRKLSLLFILSAGNYPTSLMKGKVPCVGQKYVCKPFRTLNIF